MLLDEITYEEVDITPSGDAERETEREREDVTLPPIDSSEMTDYPLNRLAEDFNGVTIRYDAVLAREFMMKKHFTGTLCKSVSNFKNSGDIKQDR